MCLQVVEGAWSLLQKCVIYPFETTSCFRVPGNVWLHWCWTIRKFAWVSHPCKMPTPLMHPIMGTQEQCRTISLKKRKTSVIIVSQVHKLVFAVRYETLIFVHRKRRLNHLLKYCKGASAYRFPFFFPPGVPLMPHAGLWSECNKRLSNFLNWPAWCGARKYLAWTALAALAGLVAYTDLKDRQEFSHSGASNGNSVILKSAVRGRARNCVFCNRSKLHLNNL